MIQPASSGDHTVGIHEARDLDATINNPRGEPGDGGLDGQAATGLRVRTRGDDNE